VRAQERPEARLGHDDEVDLLARRERELVDHGEVPRVAAQDRETPPGERARDHLEAVRELGLEQREQRAVEVDVAVGRAAAVLARERLREHLLGDGAELEEVRPEPSAEEHLRLERLAHAIGRAGTHIHEELAEARHVSAPAARR